MVGFIFRISSIIIRENTEIIILFFGGNLQKFSNSLLSAKKPSGIHIGLKRVLQLWKINHGNDFVKKLKCQRITFFKKC